MGACCSQKHEPDGFLCTEAPDHPGDHIARDLALKIVARWPRITSDRVYARVPPGHYRCVGCKEVFADGWSEEEAAAEAKALFGISDIRAPEVDVVCDECFNRMKSAGAIPS